MTKRVKMILILAGVVGSVALADYFFVFRNSMVPFGTRCSLSLGSVQEQKTGWVSWYYCESLLPSAGGGKNCTTDGECPSRFCKRQVISDMEIVGHPQPGNCSDRRMLFRDYDQKR